MKRLLLASLLAVPVLGLTQDKASAFFSVCGKYNTNINLRWCGTYNFTMPRVYFGLEWAPKPCAQPCAPSLPLPWQAAFPPQYYLALQRNYPVCPEFGGAGFGGAGCPTCPQAPQQAAPQAQAPVNPMIQAGYRTGYPAQPTNYYYNPASAGAVPSYWYGR